MLFFQIALALNLGLAIPPAPTTDTDSAQTVAANEQQPPADAPATTTPSVLTPGVYTAEDTREVKKLPRKLLRNILLDEKAIFESPFHMGVHNAPIWLLFGGATAALIATDHTTNTLLHNSPGQVRIANRISNIGGAYTLGGIVAGLYAYGLWRDNDKVREVGVVGAEALVDSLVVGEILKVSIRRNRPSAASEQGHFFESGSSFPSGHSLESWTLASVFAHEYKNHKAVAIIAYSLATVVSASRFAGQDHYASDIFVGGAMGWFIGRYAYQAHASDAGHRPKFGLKLVPIMIPSSKTFGLTATYTKG